MKRCFTIGLIVLLTVAMTACATANPTSPPQDLMTGLEPKESPTLGDLTEGSGDVTDFALTLFRESMVDGDNTLISPLSVLSALAMTANGANGQTLSQMESVLGLPLAELNLWLSTYTKGLTSDENSRLNPANAVWFTDDETFTVREDFLRLNADYFGADIYRIPFDDQAVTAINDWVNAKTQGMIPEIIDQLSADTVMCLVNALAFEAQWQEVYGENQVQADHFTLENGDRVPVELMHSTEGAYIRDEAATGFLKPYAGGEYAFVALLPNEGISVERCIQSLTGDKLHALLAGAEDTGVNVAIPKFETGYSAEMSGLLSEMGMPDAFIPSLADLSGLGTSSVGNLFINRVIHKTFIAVAEQGTKAGAATLVEIIPESAAEDSVELPQVMLNRPFVYFIVDCQTNYPIFIGTMMDPRT